MIVRVTEWLLRGRQARVGRRAGELLVVDGDQPVRVLEVVLLQAPRRQRDLEHPEADVVGVFETFHDLDGGEPDDADHRADRLAIDLLVEDVDHMAKAASIHGIALAPGPEHVAVLEPGRQDEPDLLAQEVVDQLIAVVPWRGAGDEDALR
jgi:hypothetical protein